MSLTIFLVRNFAEHLEKLVAFFAFFSLRLLLMAPMMWWYLSLQPADETSWVAPSLWVLFGMEFLWSLFWDGVFLDTNLFVISLNSIHQKRKAFYFKNLFFSYPTNTSHPTQNSHMTKLMGSSISCGEEGPLLHQTHPPVITHWSYVR